MKMELSKKVKQMGARLQVCKGYFLRQQFRWLFKAIYEQLGSCAKVVLGVDDEPVW